jgi:glycosyltransferase involved in cell wall biosynthesis
VRKSLTYILPFREKKLVEMFREKVEINKNKSYAPLVSVIIPTYNRAETLLKRALRSVLDQTYKNFEIIVVGDHCVDDTEERLRKIRDPRVKFINLPKRGNYPKEPLFRWFVAGVSPTNVGLQEAKGEWIAHLDDDDEFFPNHIEVLLKFALKHNYEMVYAIVETELSDNTWVKVGEPILKESSICRCSALYRAYLKCFKYDINSWKMKEPVDFNLWRRMKMAGVRIGFINMVVAKHYKERAQINR